MDIKWETNMDFTYSIARTQTRSRRELEINAEETKSFEQMVNMAIVFRRALFQPYRLFNEP